MTEATARSLREGWCSATANTVACSANRLGGEDQAVHLLGRSRRWSLWKAYQGIGLPDSAQDLASIALNCRAGSCYAELKQ
jgi:hypothetical protein